MAMKAKMAADKEKLKAEKRHQEVCIDNPGFSIKPALTSSIKTVLPTTSSTKPVLTSSIKLGLTRAVEVNKSEKTDGGARRIDVNIHLPKP